MRKMEIILKDNWGSIVMTGLIVNIIIIYHFPAQHLTLNEKGNNIIDLYVLHVK